MGYDGMWVSLQASHVPSHSVDKYRLFFTCGNKPLNNLISMDPTNQMADEALNHQEQVETETSMEETETTQDSDIASQEEHKEKNKDFYKVLWQKKQVEKELAELKARKEAQEAKIAQEEDDASDYYNKDDIELIEKRAEKIAERKFNELTKKQQLNDLQLKEEQAFLATHPEAIEKLEAVRRYRDTIDSEMSLQSAWKLLAPAYWHSVDKPKPKPVNMGWDWDSGKSNSVKDGWFKDWETLIGKGT